MNIYKGKVGQWAWIFHRVTGVGVLLFLIAHIVDTALIGFGPDVYNKVMEIYRHPFFKINEVFLFAAVLFHALNGVRIILVDFWPQGTRYHRQMMWAVIGLFIAGMIPVTYIMLVVHGL